MNHELMLEDAQDLKNECEAAISEALKNFIQLTGLNVQGIIFDTGTTNGGEINFLRCKIRVEL